MKTTILLALAAGALLAAAPPPAQAESTLHLFGHYAVTCEHECVLVYDSHGRLTIADSVQGGKIAWRIEDNGRQGVTTQPWIVNK